MSLANHSHAYRGPERRRHRVFVTLNSEYHCRDGVCVAVVNRHTGELVRDHPAVGRRLSGSVKLGLDGITATTPPETPHPGEQLCFTSGRPEDPHDVITSSILRVDRPAKDVVARYPAERSPPMRS